MSSSLVISKGRPCKTFKSLAGWRKSLPLSESSGPIRFDCAYRRAAETFRRRATKWRRSRGKSSLRSARRGRWTSTMERR